MTIDYAELKRLAEAAQGRNWRAGNFYGKAFIPAYQVIAETDEGACVILEGNKNFLPEAKANIAFVAAANPAAILALIAENEQLKAAFAMPERLSPKPADDYGTLRRQFGSLLTYANAKDKLCTYYQTAAEALRRIDRTQSAEEIDAERDINEQLTNDLLMAEQERDQLKAEVEELRKALTDIFNHIECNTECLVRDLVNWGTSRINPNDFYGECDAIKKIAESALSKDAGHG
ncbi:ead/Ea22-like family protein [Pseudomonas typographi]|uniref:Ead/Ea22-like family protein n=1 Tax=Pseudomonas typographi TaxID=2715964 RepID=A0ABR7Z9Q1_9PSED|nr:ead/Ea22-like family protein [Pseudomonas typographi]MBD1602107.1 hypothetical protein [Pseudomonas typographi]